MANNNINQTILKTEELIKKLNQIISKTTDTKEECISSIDKQLFELRNKKLHLTQLLEKLKETTETEHEKLINEINVFLEENAFDNIKQQFIKNGKKISELGVWAEDSWDRFHEKTRLQFNSIGNKMSNIENKASDIKNETTEIIKEDIETLKQKINEISSNLGEVKDKAGDAWNEVINGFSEAASTLKNSIDNAFKQFNK
jgi:exonuclease VII large subunit